MLDVGNGSCIELFSGGIQENIDITKQGEWIHLALATDDVDIITQPYRLGQARILGDNVLKYAELLRS